MNQEYEKLLNEEFGDCLPKSSPYTCEFWFLLEENVRRKYGYFSKKMSTFRSLRSKFAVQRNKIWQKGITPNWMEDISLGKNKYTYQFGKVFWFIFLIMLFMLLFYIFIQDRFVVNHLFFAGLTIFFAYEIKNFFIGNDTYFTAAVNSDAKEGNAYIRWVGLMFDLFCLGLMGYCLINF